MFITSTVKINDVIWPFVPLTVSVMHSNSSYNLDENEHLKVKENVHIIFNVTPLVIGNTYGNKLIDFIIKIMYMTNLLKYVLLEIK